MHPFTTRRAARLTAAAVGGVLAAALAIPGAASATMYKAYDNGVLAYSTPSNPAHTIYPDGTHDALVSTSVSPLGVPGTVGEWSVDGNRLLFSDTNKNLLDVNPWSHAQIASVDVPFDIVRPSMSPDGTVYAFGSTNNGVTLYNTDGGSTTPLLGGASDGTAWSNEDQLVVSFDGNGVYRFDRPVDNAGNQGNWAATDDPFYPLHVTVSRDGAKVAYTAFGTQEEGPSDDVFVAPGDGATPPVRIEGNTDGSNEELATISPDGKKVAFVSDRAHDGTWSIYVRDLAAETTTIVPDTRTLPGTGFSGLSWQPAYKPYLASGTITTAPEIGNTLVLDDMYDEPTQPYTTTWQWQRCTDVTGDSRFNYTGTCVDMPGETNAGYHLAAGDVDAQFRVIRTVTNAAGTDTDASEITEPAYAPDSTPPGVPTIITKPATSSNITSPAFAWTGAEGGGSFQCSIDGAAFASCTSGSTFPVTGQGPHTFRVRQTDASNNTGDPAEYDWSLDTVVPDAPTVTSQPPAVTASQSATVAFTGAEAGGSFQCHDDSEDAEWEACASPVTLTGLAEGANGLWIQQVDAAGNPGTPKVVRWTVDLTAPLAPTFTQTQDEVHAFTTQYAFTGEDGATFACRLDDAEWAPCASPVTLSDYGTGEHWLRVRQTDAAGHVGPAAEDRFDAYLDGPAAPALGDGVPAPHTNQKTATFAIGGDAARYECRLDDGDWATCASPATFEDLADGEHTFRVRGVDEYDLPGAVKTYTWTVDTAKPAQPTFSHVPPAQTTTQSIDVGFDGLEDGAVVECAVDGQEWAPCATPLRLDGFGIGRHTVKLRQTDAAGNVSDVASFAWKVVAEPVVTPPATDDTPPSAPTTTPQAQPAPTQAPTPTAPKAQDPAPTTKPKLDAVLGGGGTGSGSGTRSDATITVRKDGVGVGCSITGTVLTACKVDLYAIDTTAHASAAAASKRVLVGTGTFRQADGSKRMQVDVTLNATGRALMRKSPDGLKVSVKITGTPVKGEKLQATGVATLVRQRVNATVGGFAVNSAKLTAAARQQLSQLAAQVKGTAVAIRVVGHTDASSDDARYLKDLGLRRAQAVAAYLRAHGVKAKATLASRGAQAPKATNATAAGRAQNRRVELRIDR